MQTKKDFGNLVLHFFFPFVENQPTCHTDAVAENENGDKPRIAFNDDCRECCETKSRRSDSCVKLNKSRNASVPAVNCVPRFFTQNTGFVVGVVVIVHAHNFVAYKSVEHNIPCEHPSLMAFVIHNVIKISEHNEQNRKNTDFEKKLRSRCFVLNAVENNFRQICCHNRAYRTQRGQTDLHNHIGFIKTPMLFQHKF